MLILSSDEALPVGRLDIDIRSKGQALLSNSYRVPEEVALPTTIAINSNGDPTASVQISVTAWQTAAGKAEVPLDRRDAIVTQVPTDRLAELRVVLSARCTSKVTLRDGNAVSTCDDGSTCDGRGNCTSVQIVATTLSTYQTGDEADAGITVTPTEAGAGGGNAGGSNAGGSNAGGSPAGADAGAGGEAGSAEAGAAGTAGVANGGGNSGGTGGQPAPLACSAGYVDNGQGCVDLDECALGTSTCATDATCKNTAGSYSCTCKSGYTGDGQTCTDVDECLTASASCQANATCNNTAGSYSCVCNPGYQPAGALCVDIDECAGTNDCSKHATCTNTVGSHTCACTSNYSGNGVSCAPKSSCVDLAKNCGVTGNDDCCASLPVPGGTFKFGGAISASNGTVAAFSLDKYEVTVGRFRNFVAAYAGPPAANAGAHSLISGSGWQTAWNSAIAPDQAGLIAGVKCNDTYQTYDDSGAHDQLAINCVDWYEAFAFCAWDGAHLATEEEWEFAADGGAEERLYPWGDTPAPTNAQDSTAAYASYACLGDGSAPYDCTFGDLLKVGAKPLGAGKWGHLDLAGSMVEWVLDYTDLSLHPTTCNNCAILTPYSWRVARGGKWEDQQNSLENVVRDYSVPTARLVSRGLRCAH